MTAASDVFLAKDSKVAALINAHNWSNSVLGNPQTWPESLRNATQLLLTSSFPMFVAWGSELNFLYNDAYAEILGHKHPTAIGKPFKEVWSELWDELTPIIALVMAGEATFFENLPVIINRSGRPEEAWFTFSHSPLRDEKGDIAGIFCAITETTNHVLGERYMKSEIERQRLLFQQAPGLIIVMRGPDHVYELANEAHSRLVGDRQVLGKTVREAFPELENQGIFELLDSVYKNGVPFVGRAIPMMLQRGSNSELEERFIDFVLQPTVDFQGQISGIFVEGFDVTETVRVTNALRESENKLKQLANTIPQLAWIADSDGSINWYNDRWYDYTGTTPQEMEGWGWQKVHDPNMLPEVMKLWKHSIETGEKFQMTFPLKSKKGEFHPFFTLVSPLKNDSGKVIQWFGSNTDVTELQKVQDELSETNHRKDEFLATLAHELRNPLAPIRNSLSIMELKGNDLATVKKARIVIERQVLQMVRLIDDLMDVSRISHGKIELQPTNIYLADVLSSAVESSRPLIEAAQLDLTVNIPPTPITLHADSTRLTQVFLNLLNNAAKFTNPGGHVEINVDLLIENLIEHVIVKIIDDGIGMALEDQSKIFQGFTQLNNSLKPSHGGLGIGLMLVKRFIEMHGGSVKVSSDGLGLGTVFTVKLPILLTEYSSNHKNQVFEAPNAISTKMKILVVDDNIDAAISLSNYFEALGHETTVEHDGESAIKKAELYQPNVILLDIGMPGLNGYEVAKYIRKQHWGNSIKLLAITGWGQENDRQKSALAGFDAHLVKPVDLQILTDLLSELLV